jgi:nucleotide-binding universal stress UspA family protein
MNANDLTMMKAGHAFCSAPQKGRVARPEKEILVNKVKKVLVPTDLSELSKTGMRYALEMAEWQGVEVIVYHVIEYQEFSRYSGDLRHKVPGLEEVALKKDPVEARRKLLSKFLAENFADILWKIKIHQEVDVGFPYKRIVEKAVEEGVDVIVMSTHGRTGLLHMMIGSVTEKVVRHATCSVLSIRPGRERIQAEVAAG